MNIFFLYKKKIYNRVKTRKKPTKSQVKSFVKIAEFYLYKKKVVEHSVEHILRIIFSRPKKSKN